MLQGTKTKQSSRTIQFSHNYHKHKAVDSKLEKIEMSGILPPTLFATRALHSIPQRFGPPQS